MRRGISTMPARDRRRGAQRGRLSLLDVLVIAALLGILLAAAVGEFPGLGGRATPPAAPDASETGKAARG